MGRGWCGWVVVEGVVWREYKCSMYSRPHLGDWYKISGWIVRVE